VKSFTFASSQDWIFCESVPYPNGNSDEMARSTTTITTTCTLSRSVDQPARGHAIEPRRYDSSKTVREVMEERARLNKAARRIESDPELAREALIRLGLLPNPL